MSAFSGDIDTSATAIAAHARDSSVFRVEPKEVVFPRTVDDIRSILQHIGEGGGHVAVRAGGTCMTGGSLTDGTAMNLTRYMNRVEVDPARSVATVEAGAMFRDIEAAAAAHGLMFAPYPSSKNSCGIGGMLGNNASGERSIRYGATSDNVSSLEALLHDGTLLRTRPMARGDFDRAVASGTPEGVLYKLVDELYQAYGKQLEQRVGKVPKASSGYRLDRVWSKDGSTFNLTPLFIGSQGTLGIITKAELSLVPMPANPALLVVPVRSLDSLASTLAVVLQHQPNAVETFDVRTFDHACAANPDGTTCLRFLFDGETELVIMAEFDRRESLDEAWRCARECMLSLEKIGTTAHEVADVAIAEALWRVRRSSFAVFRDFTDGTRHAVPCIEDIIVPLGSLGKLVAGLREILGRYQLTYGFHGHIGDGALRVIPVFDLADPATPARIVALMHEVFDLAQKLGGNISADHSDGIVRTPFLERFYGEVYPAFAKLKQLFDPRNILNPRKKVGGTVADIERHILRA